MIGRKNWTPVKNYPKVDFLPIRRCQAPLINEGYR